MNSCKWIAVTALSLLLATCGEEEPKNSATILFSPSGVTIGVGETYRVGLKTAAGNGRDDYDFQADALGVTLTSDDETIVTTAPGGIIRGVGVGRTFVTARARDGSSARLSVTVSLDFGKPLVPEMIYAKGMTLYHNMAMQSFDISSEGDIFLAGVLEPAVHIQKCPRNGTPGEAMTLYYAGHATNMSIEEEGGDTYIWIANFGTKYPNGQYFGEQIVSRIRFEPGRSYLPEECEDNYYVGAYKNLCVAVDTENDLLAILFADNSVSGGNTRINVYALSAAKSLPVGEATLLQLSRGGESGGPRDAETLTPRIRARDLTKLKPLHELHVNSSRLNGDLPMQGYCICKDRIYWYAGSGGRNDSGATPPRANVSELDMSGTVVRLWTPVGIAGDVALLDRYGLTDTGYFEAEGIKIRDGKCYLGFITNGKQDAWKWRAHVFRIN